MLESARTADTGKEKMKHIAIPALLLTLLVLFATVGNVLAQGQDMFAICHVNSANPSDLVATESTH